MEIPEMLPDRPVASTLKGLWIPGEILHNSDLTYQEKILAALIWNMDNPPHRCYASNAWFALQMGVKESYVANMMSSLRKKKIVRQLKWDGRIRIIGIEKEAL
jgi:hypothetical protein